MHPKIAKTRSRVGVAYRTGDPHAIAEASRDHAAAKLEAFIESTLAAAPPLTDEQRDKLALLLRTGAPPGRPAHEEPIPAANPVSGSHLPHTETEGQVRVPAGGAGQ